MNINCIPYSSSIKDLAPAVFFNLSNVKNNLRRKSFCNQTVKVIRKPIKKWL